MLLPMNFASLARTMTVTRVGIAMAVALASITPRNTIIEILPVVFITLLVRNVFYLFS